MEAIEKIVVDIAADQSYEGGPKADAHAMCYYNLLYASSIFTYGISDEKSDKLIDLDWHRNTGIKKL